MSFPCGHTPRYLATTLLDAQAYPSEGINARAGYRSPELNTLSTFEGYITIFFLPALGSFVFESNNVYLLDHMLALHV